jgi:hypothetical protein
MHIIPIPTWVAVGTKPLVAADFQLWTFQHRNLKSRSQKVKKSGKSAQGIGS